MKYSNTKMTMNTANNITMGDKKKNNSNDIDILSRMSK